MQFDEISIKRLIFSILILLIGLLLISIAETDAQTDKHKSDPKLIKIADGTLQVLRKSIKKDGFSSAMGALNIWRSTAKDAGVFNQALYDDFRRQIYQKSINNILKWFDICLKEGWEDEANFCCKVYYFKANQIKMFDEERYNEMKAKVKELEKKKREEKKTKRSAR